MEFLVCPLYTFIIPHLRWLVKGFCEKILFFFAPLRVRYCIAHNPLLFQPLGALVQIYIPQIRTPCGRKSLSGRSYSVTLRPHSSCCLPSFCIYYTTLCGVCQGVFQNFFEFFEEFLRQIMLSRASLRHSPLDTYIIPQTAPKVKMAKCTNLGKIIAESLSILPIDKLLRLWYNGNFGRSTRERPTNYIIPFGFCQGVFEK